MCCKRCRNPNCRKLAEGHGVYIEKSQMQIKQCYSEFKRQAAVDCGVLDKSDIQCWISIGQLGKEIELISWFGADPLNDEKDDRLKKTSTFQLSRGCAVKCRGQGQGKLQSLTLQRSWNLGHFFVPSFESGFSIFFIPYLYQGFLINSIRAVWSLTGI